MPRDGKLRAQFAALHAGSGMVFRPYRRPSLPISKTYCILFTPRSGSTWLCRRIARLDVLSCPEEYFNTDEFMHTLAFNPGRDVYEVFDIVASKNRTNNGVFGFKISYFDLEEFEREARLLDVMPGAQYFFYLRRRNFVAQAISLYKAVETRVFHIYERGPPQPPQLPYDDDRIMYWACHILQQEYGFQRWLAAAGVRPLALWYEELLDGIDAAIDRIACHLGVDLSGALALATPQTERLNSDRDACLEHVFRDRHWQFCRSWEAARGTAPCPYVGAAPVPMR